MIPRKSVARAALEVALKSLREFQRFESGVESDSPRAKFGCVRAFPGIMFCEAIPEVRCVASIESSWVNDALKNVGVEHKFQV
jgi:hypothetical protein